ncbi:hypothetical protein [Streptomyces yunnanensis]|uniref:Uncharacterized protein n=1 Tax=Streptomyces yunnanensis TaxID=156453 RepID=A0A9X8N6C7_9ACTN|nr:hypothetical protein [Streptomyces yunnanensis]SHN14543.1 hypothetical protein SAMN05216268_12147 [Streptomyces yunnanensis]
MGDLVKGLIEPVAKRWSAVMGGPLLLFWLAGGLIVLWRRGSGAHPCRTPGFPVDAPCTIAAQRPLGLILLTAAATAVVAMSAWALSASAGFVLEVLAGRWGTSRIALVYTRHRMARHRARRSDLADRRQVPPAGLNGEDLDAWQSQNGWRVTWRRAAYARYPRVSDYQPLLPTAVGNALVSVSAEARRTYGLDLAVCWDPFVKALETPVRDELTAAATRVFARVQGLVCAAATACWAIVIPGMLQRLLWVAMCALLVWGAHRSLRAGVDAYCRHVTGLFAVHRVRLYRALGFTLPATAQEEVSCGTTLSAALSRTLRPGSAPVPYEWPSA